MEVERKRRVFISVADKRYLIVLISNNSNSALQIACIDTFIPCFRVQRKKFLSIMLRLFFNQVELINFVSAILCKSYRTSSAWGLSIFYLLEVIQIIRDTFWLVLDPLPPHCSVPPTPTRPFLCLCDINHVSKNYYKNEAWRCLFHKVKYIARK